MTLVSPPRDDAVSPSGDVFDLLRPAGEAGWMVFASPHSGGVLPLDIGVTAGVSEATLRSAEDVAVDRLIGGAVGHGVPVLSGRISRTYVDLNRDPGELDPALIDGVADAELSAKVSAGFGVLPRRAGDGTPLYRRRLSWVEAKERITRVHTPYHAALDQLMTEAKARHGAAMLIDWHSMPARAAGVVGRMGRGVDIILGDRHGSACRGGTTRRARALFEAQGWRVGLNAPYAGGYATQRWGRPSEGFQALQVEINRALYLDEATLEPSADFDRFSRALAKVIARLAAEPVT